jgi:hypothetical protein
MSHFSVLVCLPADTALPHLETRLEEIMAVWDENLRVGKYSVIPWEGMVRARPVVSVG